MTSNTSGVTLSSGGIFPSSNSTATSLGSSTQRWIISANTGDFTGAVNAASHTVGTSFIANSSQLTVSGIPLSANGSTGTSGQLLTSNGTTGSPYWTTITQGASGFTTPVNTTYGGYNATASKNSYYGVLMGSNTSHLNYMADTSGNGGMYREASGVWPFYYNVTNAGVGIMASTTSSSYALS